MPDRQGAPLSPLSPFRYRGPISGVTLRQAGAPPLETMLYDGELVQLPANHPHVKALVARGFLTPEVAPIAQTAAADSTSARAIAPRGKPEAQPKS